MSKTKTGTREWAARTINCCLGCSHNCLYCYAAERAARFKRRRRQDWGREEPAGVEDLPKRVKHREGWVMFPSSHDITPGNAAACRQVIAAQIEAGNDLLLVSKPSWAVWGAAGGLLNWLAEILRGRNLAFSHGDDLPRGKLLLRFTIGAIREPLRKLWEPGAPPFAERIRVLQQAARLGFATSVSAEPLLDPPRALDLAEAVQPWCCDTLWIGAMNDVRRRVGWAFQDGSGLDEDRQFDLWHEFQDLEAWQTPAAMGHVYDRLKGLPRIRWKDSYQKALGLAGPEGGAK